MNYDKFYGNAPLSEEIEKIIRVRILKGQYSIGERIKESQLAYELKVSRTPIREAFRQLEKEGLIQTIPNRGSFAIGFTKQDIQDIYEVRAAVEKLAIERAILKISEDEMSALQETFDLMEFFTSKKDSKKIMELNRTFHRTIYDTAGSRFLSQILKAYEEYVEQTRKVTVYCGDNLAQILKEHGEILEAIKNKDSKMAMEKTSVHLNNSRRRAEKSIITK